MSSKLTIVNDCNRLQVAISGIKFNVSFWLAGEYSSARWPDVNKDTKADISLGLSSDKWSEKSHTIATVQRIVLA